MDYLRGLPFKVGDCVELKSFETGYRGAWFRCKIKETSKRGVAMDLYDYPEEEITWMKSFYRKAPCKSSRGSKVELMLRPKYPPLYSEGEAPDLNSLSEVIVVTNGTWKVGDLVDWLCDGAYWSGTIIKFLEDGKLQLKSPPRPMGEGLVYDALCKNLRPSLKWSAKSGWTVPVPRGKDNYCPCAKLIEPVNQDQNAGAHCSSEHSLPISLREKGTDNEATIVVLEEQREAEGRMKDAKGSCSDSVSSALNKDQLPEIEETAERIKLNKNIPLNSSKCDSVESLIMDMEELLNRVKWMKRILKPPPNAANAGWKFEEYRAGGTTPGS